MLDDYYFMKLALGQAEIAKDRGEVPVGCIVTINNRVIAKAYNLTETLNDVTAHAEMQAITSSADFLGGKYLVNCTMYITLEPCVMCAGALAWAQVSRVVIGARDLQRGFLAKNLSLHPKTELITGVMEEECGEIVRAFFRERR